MTDYEMRFDPLTGEPIRPSQEAQNTANTTEEPIAQDQTNSAPVTGDTTEASATQQPDAAPQSGEYAGQANLNYTVERPFVRQESSDPFAASFSDPEAFRTSANDFTSSGYYSPTGNAPFGPTTAQGANIPNIQMLRQAQKAEKKKAREEKKKQKRAKAAKPLTRRSAVVLLAACLVLSLAVGMFGSAASSYLMDHFDIITADSNKKVTEVPGSASGAPVVATDKLTMADTKNNDVLTVAEIASKVGDSVVEIVTEYVTEGFRTTYTSEGAGSGVILSEDGYIVTNNHVISKAANIHIRLRNGDYYEAKLIGTDADSDIAVLKIEATGLTIAELGDSSKIVVGESCVAIGNPLGTLGGTVTSGIISALDREITIDGETMTLLQTNAAVNPGNSGGGLFNNKGELIGIVNAKSSGTNVEGLGFAIPVNTAIPVIEDLMTDGYVHGRFSLGVSLVDIQNYQTAAYYGVSDYGVYIYNVNEDSNADDAGLKMGDLILRIDGTEVSTSDDVKKLLDTKNAGESMEFVIDRNGKEKTITVTLKEAVPEVADDQ